MALILTAAAGAIGAVARYGAGGWVQTRSRAALPVGTAVVNLTGAFAVGVVAAATGDGSLLRAAGVGFLGGFTTFSTWMVESVLLAQTGGRRRWLAAANLGIMLGAGVALAGAGRAVAG